MAHLRVLVAGLGGIGQRHIRNLRSVLGSDLELIAYRVRNLPQVVTDRLDVEAGGDVFTKYGLQVSSDLAEALSWPPDVVFVCNPTSLHLPIAIAAARAGCHLFIEKPLSHTWDGVDELIRLVESKSLLTLVGYQMRFHPGLLRTRELLTRGTIGRLLGVRIEMGEYLPDWHPYEDYRHSYAARSDLGGGVILSQIHELDYVYWLFGLPRRVYAVGGHLSLLETDVEDVASILMECVVDGRPLPVHIHQDYVQRPATRTCEIIGDAGKILLDLRAPSLRAFDNHGALMETDEFEGFERNQLFLDETRHFLACLGGQQQPIVSAREGAQSLRIALAARESLATGTAVSLQQTGHCAQDNVVPGRQ